MYRPLGWIGGAMSLALLLKIDQVYLDLMK